MSKQSTKAVCSYQSWTAWPSHLHFTGHSGEGLRISDCWYWQEEVLSSVWHHRGPVHVDHQEEDSTAIWEGNIPLCRQDCPTIQVRGCSLGIQNHYKQACACVTQLFNAHLVILGDVCHILISLKVFFPREFDLELGWKERWLKNILWLTSIAKGWALQLQCCCIWLSEKICTSSISRKQWFSGWQKRFHIKYSIASAMNYSEKTQ